MRNFKQILGAGLIALFFTFSGFVGSAFAFSHGAPSTNKLEYLQNEIDYHTNQVNGLAIHGEHVMWRVATPAVLATAEALGLDVSSLAARVAKLDVVSSAALTDDTLRDHINIVHPVHDEVANLVRQLNLTVADHPEVLALNATLLAVRDMHRDNAVCAYVAEAAYLNDRRDTPDIQGIDYSVDANAALWRMVDVSQNKPLFASPTLVLLGVIWFIFSAITLWLTARIAMARKQNPAFT